ncbi:MAG: hypothetical protein WBG46_14165 [Nonlabens sp.]
MECRTFTLSRKRECINLNTNSNTVYYMSRLKTYICFLSLLLPVVLAAQADPTSDKLIAALNVVLQDNHIPTIASAEDMIAQRTDDFEFVEKAIEDFQPHDRNKEACGDCKFFAIPKTSFLGYRCIKGNCQNKDGILEIEKDKIYFLGTFEDSYAQGEGVLYFVGQGFFKGIFQDGYLIVANFLNKNLEGAKLVNQDGQKMHATNWFHAGYNAYYAGGLNAELSPIPTEKGVKLYSPFMQLQARFDDQNELDGFYGTIEFERDNKIQGNYDKDLNLMDGPIVWTRVTGEVIYAHTKSGNILRDKVRIEHESTIYEGSVDENFKPHGHGIAVSNGIRLQNEIWIHGDPEKPEPTESSEREALISELKRQCSEDWSTYSVCRVFKQSFTIKAKGTKKLLLINLSKKDIRFKAKMNFVPSNSTFGFKGKWIEIYIPASKSLTDISKLSYKQEYIPFPYEMGNYEIKLKGNDLDKVFWSFMEK